MKAKHSLQITTSLLVSYAYGILAPDIAVQVKKALEQDELLRLQYQGIIQLIKDYPDEDPEELLEQMGADVGQKINATQQQPPATKPHYRRWLPVAAVLITLAGIGTFIAVQRNRQSPEQLATVIIKQNSANPYSNATRGNTAPADSTAAWKDAFVNHRYGRVVLYLKNKTPLNVEEQFFLALAYLKTVPPQPAAATPLLKQLVVASNNYTPDAWLYLGLAQTLDGKKAAAIESLSHVEQTAQVKELLERLRQ